MKFFTFSEMLLSLVTSVAFGVLGGVIYRAFLCAVLNICDAIKSIVLEICQLRYTSIKELWQNPRMNICACTGVARQIVDFLFFLVYFNFFVMIAYICLDGMMRMFMIISAVISFYLAGRWLSKHSLDPINRLLHTVNKCVLTVVFSIVHIIRIIIGYIFHKMKVIYNLFFGKKLDKNARV